MGSTFKVKSEPQNIEQEISNDEVWNRFAQSISKIIMIEYLTSIFVIPCSIFVIRFFKVSFFRLNRPFDWPAVTLNPEPHRQMNPALSGGHSPPYDE
jgi:hypothetical protein